MSATIAVKIMGDGARYLLALSFVFAATTKLVSSEQFFSFIASVSLLSSFNPVLLLYCVVALEFAVAALLVFPETKVAGALCSFHLLLAFTILLVVVSYKGVSVPCGCFGGYVGDNSLDVSILRNIGLLVVSCFIGQKSVHQMVES